MPKPPFPEQENGDHNYSKWLGIGIEFCGVLGLFSYIGYRLDKVFNSSPVCFLASFAIGFAGMFYLILKQTRDVWRK